MKPGDLLTKCAVSLSLPRNIKVSSLKIQENTSKSSILYYFFKIETLAPRYVSTLFVVHPQVVVYISI